MSSQLAAATAVLVKRFRRQRPLRGGSLLVTIFGDAIAPRGGAITLASLIGLAAPFGLNERLVRTAMARVAAEGWLGTTRHGRLSEYHLTQEGRQRFATATQHIYGVPDQPWSGRWTLALLPVQRGSRRKKARDRLHWAGFGEPVPGLFIHPNPSDPELEQLLRLSPDLAEAIVFTSATTGAAAHRQLVQLGWDLAHLITRYRRFVAQFTPALVALDERAAPPPLPSFLLRTLLIHEYRRIHLRDPLLPADLLPPDWVGAEAYRLCRAIYERITPAAEAHLDAHARTLQGTLPPATTALSGRFGGIYTQRR